MADIVFLNGHIHALSPGTGEDNPLVYLFFINKIIQYLVLYCKVSSLNDFVTVFPIQPYMRPNLTLP